MDMSRDRMTHLAREAGNFNEGGKAAFKKEATRLLRRLAKDLELPKGSYSVRFNKAGPAVSGDAVLHGEDIYVCLGGTFNVGMLRSCKGRKDYTGGVNRWWAHPGDYETLLAQCRSARGAA